MSYYQQCTMGTFLLCSIYVFILHAGQPTASKPAFSNDLMLASVRKRLLILHSDITSCSIWVNTAFPLNSYKQLDFFPLLNQPGIRALENLHGFSFRSLFFFSEIFIPSSSSRPYQYITVVFRNSLPSATEDTQEPRISQQLTSC